MYVRFKKINFSVRAILIASGLSTPRAERKLATLHSQKAIEMNPYKESVITADWIRDLIKCRPEVSGLDDSAVSTCM